MYYDQGLRFGWPSRPSTLAISLTSVPLHVPRKSFPRPSAAANPFESIHRIERGGRGRGKREERREKREERRESGGRTRERKGNTSIPLILQILSYRYWSRELSL